MVILGFYQFIMFFFFCGTSALFWTMAFLLGRVSKQSRIIDLIMEGQDISWHLAQNLSGMGDGSGMLILA
jgi:hypothetical protein